MFSAVQKVYLNQDPKSPGYFVRSLRLFQPRTVLSPSLPSGINLKKKQVPNSQFVWWFLPGVIYRVSLVPAFSAKCPRGDICRSHVAPTRTSQVQLPHLLLPSTGLWHNQAVRQRNEFLEHVMSMRRARQS